MAPLYITDGKLIYKNGGLGTTQACCCGGDTLCWLPGSLIGNWDVDCVPDAGNCKPATYGAQAKRLCSPTCSCAGSPFCTIPFNSGILPAISGAKDCYNLCYAVPHAGQAQMTTKFYTRGTTSITTIYGPTFTVTVDSEAIRTQYPVTEGWDIYYTEETIYTEKRIMQCAYTPKVKYCIGSRANIRFWAYKKCQFNVNDPAREEITDTVVTASVPVTAGAIQDSVNEYYIWSRNDGGCGDPTPLLGWVDSQILVCSTGCPPVPSGSWW